MSPRVLWRDEHLLFVLKPPGMPAQGDPSGDPSLVDWVGGHDPVHRLDRPVGGVTVFGLTPESVRSLSRQFAERTARKFYRGVATSCPDPPEGTLIHYLAKDARGARIRKGPPAKRAELAYRLLRQLDGLALLELDPRTGRYHQIRAQLGAIGCPLVGDVRYGARKALKDRSIALWAYRLEVRHPVSGQEIAVECAPEGAVWDRF